MRKLKQRMLNLWNRCEDWFCNRRLILRALIAAVFMTLVMLVFMAAAVGVFWTAIELVKWIFVRLGGWMTAGIVMFVVIFCVTYAAFREEEKNEKTGESISRDRYGDD